MQVIQHTIEMCNSDYHSCSCSLLLISCSTPPMSMIVTCGRPARRRCFWVARGHDPDTPLSFVRSATSLDVAVGPPATTTRGLARIGMNFCIRMGPSRASRRESERERELTRTMCHPSLVASVLPPSPARVRERDETSPPPSQSATPHLGPIPGPPPFFFSFSFNSCLT